MFLCSYALFSTVSMRAKTIEGASAAQIDHLIAGIVDNIVVPHFCHGIVFAPAVFIVTQISARVASVLD